MERTSLSKDYFNGLNLLTLLVTQTILYNCKQKSLFHNCRSYKKIKFTELNLLTLFESLSILDVMYLLFFKLDYFRYFLVNV